MQTTLLPNETLVKEGAANLQRGLETVGGKLFLTSQHLIFESHAFNIQTGATVLDLREVQTVRPAWTKFLGFLPLMPNSVTVVTRQGQEYSFVVFGRTQWIAAIQGQAARTR